MINNKKIQIHGNGKNKRHYLFVKDFCGALEIIIRKVNTGIYNVGSNECFENIKIAKKMIENHGGKNVSSISKNTTFVLAGYNMGPNKREKAIELGISIINEEEFLSKIK